MYGSKYLLNKRPMLFSSDIACAFGSSDKAIIIQQLKYWLEKPIAKTIEGRRWIYNSIKQWHNDNFPYWSESKVRRNFEELESAGVIITGVFNKAGFDRTKWYSLDEEKLDEIVDNYFNISTESTDTTHLSKNENDLVKMTKCISSKRQNANVQNEQMDLVKMSRPIPETTQRLPESTSVDYLSQETVQDSYEGKDDLSSKDDLRDKKMEDIQAKILTTKIIDYFVDEYTKINNGENDFKPPMVTVNEAQKLMPVSKKLIQAKLPNAEIYRKIDISLVKNGVDYYFGYMLSVLDNFAEQELRRKQNES